MIAVVIGTWGLLRDSVNLSLDAVPPGIDQGEVEGYLRGLPGVTEVHDLHICAQARYSATASARAVTSGSLAITRK